MQNKKIMFDNIAIIAGSGNLPFKIATYLKKLNSKFIVLSIKGFSNISLYKNFKSYSLRMGEGYKAIKILKENNIKKIVFLGGLERPSLKTLRPDLWTFFKVFSFIFFKKTDDVILRNVISIFENEGFQVIGLSNITDKYFLILRSIKSNKNSYLFIKLKKVHQDDRVDLPTFGFKTLKKLVKTNIKYIILDANYTVVLDKSKVLSYLKKYKITLISVDIDYLRKKKIKFMFGKPHITGLSYE